MAAQKKPIIKKPAPKIISKRKPPQTAEQQRLRAKAGVVKAVAKAKSANSSARTAQAVAGKTIPWTPARAVTNVGAAIKGNHASNARKDVRKAVANYNKKAAAAGAKVIPTRRQIKK